VAEPTRDDALRQVSRRLDVLADWWDGKGQRDVAADLRVLAAEFRPSTPPPPPPAWVPRVGDVIVRGEGGDRLIVTAAGRTVEADALWPAENEAQSFRGITWHFDTAAVANEDVRVVHPTDQTLWERVKVAEVVWDPDDIDATSGHPLDTVEGRMLAELLNPGDLDGGWPSSMTELIEWVASAQQDRLDALQNEPGE